jgi:hypothetical protein
MELVRTLRNMGELGTTELFVERTVAPLEK